TNSHPPHPNRCGYFYSYTTNKTTPPINLGVWLIFIGSVYQVSGYLIRQLKFVNLIIKYKDDLLVFTFSR
ncbi:hypothetical protein E1E62_12285, partial [Staphylococcus aureus]|nr:hypothetical protein [Staphylococcus aureus]